MSLSIGARTNDLLSTAAKRMIDDIRKKHLMHLMVARAKGPLGSDADGPQT